LRKGAESVRLINMSGGADQDFAKLTGATLGKAFDTLSERLLAVPNPFLASESATGDERKGRP
jgi:hypothetical protein